MTPGGTHRIVTANTIKRQIGGRRREGHTTLLISPRTSRK